MKKIISYLAQYFREVNKSVLMLCTCMTGVLVYLNFTSGLEDRLTTLPVPFGSFWGHYLLFFFTFGFAYLFFLLIEKKNYFKDPYFSLMLLVAPAIFSLKMDVDTRMELSDNDWLNAYLNTVLYWPLRVLLITGSLALLWYRFHKRSAFYGLTVKSFSWKPYFLMLCIMVPLIAAASTQPDFLLTYPKLKSILPIPDEREGMTWLYAFIFEISYGSDFFSIEIFFRGFLVIGLTRWVGKDAILPMACFYCTIHFGKPLGECISSYFGGLLLGIVSYHTRSIYGGLIVHVGIAWLMELGGWIGNAVPEESSS